METHNQENNTLDLSSLNSHERKERLFTLLRSFPVHMSYSERTSLIAARVGMSHKSLLQLARRNGWAARLAVELAAEKERAEYNAQLQATAPQVREASSIQVAGSIRGLAFTLLGAARRYVDTLCLSLAYYSDKIALRIAEAGGLANLDATAAREVAELQAKLSYTAKQLQPYMVPSALGSLLSIIDFTSRLPVNQEEVETTHFTIAALQAKMLELGMGSAFGSPKAATEGFTDQPLPLLDGWTNHSTTSPLQFFDESEPDKL